MAYSTALEVTFDAATVTLTGNSIAGSTCPLKYSAAPASDISSGVVTFNVDTRLMSIKYDNNNKAGGPYNIVITPQTPTGETFHSDVDITTNASANTYALTITQNPCEESNITFAAGDALTDPQTYTLGEGAKNIQWNAFTYTTANPSSATCVVSYDVTTASTALNNAEAFTADNTLTGRKIVVNTSL